MIQLRLSELVLLGAIVIGFAAEGYARVRLPETLPCRAEWMADKCDRAFGDPERYALMVRQCIDNGFHR